MIPGLIQAGGQILGQIFGQRGRRQESEDRQNEAITNARVSIGSRSALVWAITCGIIMVGTWAGFGDAKALAELLGERLTFGDIVVGILGYSFMTRRFGPLSALPARPKETS